MSRDKLSNGVANIYVAISIKMMPCDMFKHQVSQSLFNEKNWFAKQHEFIVAYEVMLFYDHCTHECGMSLTIPLKCCDMLKHALAVYCFCLML